MLCPSPRIYNPSTTIGSMGRTAYVLYLHENHQHPDGSYGLGFTCRMVFKVQKEMQSTLYQIHKKNNGQSHRIHISKLILSNVPKNQPKFWVIWILLSLINNSHINSQHFHCPHHLCHLPGTFFCSSANTIQSVWKHPWGFGYRTPAPRLLAIFRVFFEMKKQRTKQQHGERMNQNRFLKIKVVSLL